MEQDHSLMSSSNNSEKVRELIFERFKEDLIGPIYGKQEKLNRDIAREGPEAEYLLGMLYPKKRIHSL